LIPELRTEDVYPAGAGQGGFDYTPENGVQKSRSAIPARDRFAHQVGLGRNVPKSLCKVGEAVQPIPMQGDGVHLAIRVGGISGDMVGVGEEKILTALAEKF